MTLTILDDRSGVAEAMAGAEGEQVTLRFINESRWQQGANAARAGAKSKDCPYGRLSYDFVTWHNGWAMAAHMQAKEEDAEL